MKESDVIKLGIDALKEARLQFKGTALARVMNQCFAKFEEQARKLGIEVDTAPPPIPDKLELLAREIHQFLRSFERNPRINIDRSPDKTGLHDYYNASASATTQSVRVTYITYQGSTPLTKEQAKAYLAWLRAGNVGRHFEALRALEEKR